MDDPSSARRRSRAEEILIEFLARPEGEAPEDFEALCRAHPELEDELRRLWAEVQETDLLEQLIGRPPTVTEQLSVHLGHAVEPGVDLPPPDGSGHGWPALHERLAREGPHGSRYDVRGEIARGGMGLVLEVWDRDLRRSLAMKVVGSDDDLVGARPDLRTLTRFLEEAQITGQLQHPGIVPVHELGLGQDARAYFTMPFVRGRELKEILPLAREQREGWSQERALGVLVKVCEAVAFAHSKGVLHRDLKPSNVMVGRFGETYVMDWGLARVMGRRDSHDLRLREVSPDSGPVSTEREVTPGAPGSPLLTMDGDVVGTPSYMAPEQARGRSDELGPRADVYSIGAMLYHLLTGRMPYVESSARLSPQAVLAQLLQGPPPSVLELEPTVAPELAEVCAKAMAPDPQRRYASALELARDLEAYLGSRPVTAHEASPAYLLRLAYRRQRPVFLTAALALVALVLWGVVYVLQIRSAYELQQKLSASAAAAEERTQRLSDGSLVKYLLDEASQLSPGSLEATRQLQQWLEQADDLLARRALHRGRLDAEPERADLTELVDALDRLEQARARITVSEEQARTLRALTIDTRLQAWNAAAADVATSPRYTGLSLEPQTGLVPLRRDAVSDLWEFWLLLSGEEPGIDAQDELVVAPETAVVLVLVPPGPDPLAQPAFFLGKYEVTRAQWERVMGPGFPSYAAMLQEPGKPPIVSPVNPMESISWYDAQDFAERLGCTLPHERDWERAVRAGSTSYFWWGEHPDEGEGLENLFDQSAAYLGIGGPIAPWDDGFPVLAPVGTFEPNPNGLYDMAGNVAEWCANWWSLEDRPDETSPRKAFRGGSWYTAPGVELPNGGYSAIPASDFRQGDNPRGLNQARGMRLARPLQSGLRTGR